MVNKNSGAERSTDTSPILTTGTGASGDERVQRGVGGGGGQMGRGVGVGKKGGGGGVEGWYSFWGFAFVSVPRL